MKRLKMKNFFNKEVQRNEISEQIEETKDKLFYMYFGRNGFNR
ncbi:MAG TPA: hypothetical protein PK466_14960 [Thermotogota bacterium]|nr:hypothetical protein [Thermotogota bacterium]